MEIVGVGQKLNQIHIDLANKFRTSKRNEQATILNEFLQALKYRLYMAKHSGSSYILDQAVADKYNKMLNKILSNKNTTGLANLLSYEKDSGQRDKYTQGEALEYGLVDLLKELGKQCGQSAIEHTGKDKGKIFAASKFQQMSETGVKDFSGAIISAIEESVGQKFEENVKTKLKNGIEKSAQTSQKSVDIKSDMQVGNYRFDIKITADDIELKNLVSQIEKALSNCRITLKNYQLEGKNYDFYQGDKTRSLSDIGIHLAEINESLFKEVTGSLSELGISTADYAASIYYAGISVILGGGHTSKPIDVINHFSHLRFVFALRGSGFLVNNRMQFPADYLIWNNPYGVEIVCQSTAQIVYDLIFKETSAAANYLGKSVFYHLDATKHSYTKNMNKKS